VEAYDLKAMFARRAGVLRRGLDCR